LGSWLGGESGVTDAVRAFGQHKSDQSAWTGSRRVIKFQKAAVVFDNPGHDR
jgi:hypothetical protein